MDTGKLVLALILLILGAAAGYFYGFDVGYERGADSVETGLVVTEEVIEEETEEGATTTDEVAESNELE